jgi:hypothetical protein
MIQATPMKKGRSDFARPSSKVRSMTAASRLIQQDSARTINNQIDGTCKITCFESLFKAVRLFRTRNDGHEHPRAHC